jgi:hypothetical protein
MKMKNSKVMKQKTLLLCLILITIFYSCKKEEIGTSGNSANTNTDYVAVLGKVLVDNQSAYEYQYNDSNLIVQEKSKYDFTSYNYKKGLLVSSDSYGNDDVLSNDIQVFQAAINKKEWVTPDNGKKGGTITYSYDNNGLLIKSTYTRPSAASSEYSEFSYNSSKRIAKQTMYWDNVATGYIDYTYDGSGNLVKEMLYNLPASGPAELITTTQYTFDNAPNPYKSTRSLMIPGVNTNKNNIIKEVYTIKVDPAQGADKVQTTETTYSYNAMGYPATKNGNISFVYN